MNFLKGSCLQGVRGAEEVPGLCPHASAVRTRPKSVSNTYLSPRL